MVCAANPVSSISSLRAVSNIPGSLFLRCFKDVLIDSIPVLFQQFAPVTIEGKDGHRVTGVNNYSTFGYPFRRQSTLLNPEPPATEDLHLPLVLDWIPLANSSECLFAEVA